MTTLIHFYDDVDPAKIPADATRVAYYVDGRYANHTAMKARFPNAEMFGITVHGSLIDDAICCDCESGDMTVDQAVAWVEQKLAAGAVRPIVYANQETWDNQGLKARLAAYGSRIRRWVAAYPGTGANVPAGYDAHQFADTVNGVSVDSNVAVPSFWTFDPKPKPKPKPTYDEGVAVAEIHFKMNGAKHPFEIKGIAGDHAVFAGKRRTHRFHGAIETGAGGGGWHIHKGLVLPRLRHKQK